MGCDIHLFVETRIKDKWVPLYGIPDYFIFDYENIIPPDGKSKEEIIKFLLDSKPCLDNTGIKINRKYLWSDKIESVDLYDIDWLYGNRNYILFGFLAGVRSDVLNCITGDDLRGIPDDCSSKVLDMLEIADHSFNWVTLKELLDFDLLKEVSYPCVKYLTEDEYKLYKQDENIIYNIGFGWTCAQTDNVYGAITIQEMEDRINSKSSLALENDKRHRRVGIACTTKYIDHLANFYNRLKVLDGFTDPENIRLVYGFDN